MTPTKEQALNDIKSLEYQLKPEPNSPNADLFARLRSFTTQQGEPVAWQTVFEGGGRILSHSEGGARSYEHGVVSVEPLYTHPAPQYPEDETDTDHRPLNEVLADIRAIPGLMENIAAARDQSPKVEGEANIWIVLREPRKVPQRKGPFNRQWAKDFIREVMKDQPTAARDAATRIFTKVCEEVKDAGPLMADFEILNAALSAPQVTPGEVKELERCKTELEHLRRAALPFVENRFRGGRLWRYRLGIRCMMSNGEIARQELFYALNPNEPRFGDPDAPESAALSHKGGE